MARQFVTLDNFMDPGDGSMDGWSRSMRGRVTNTDTITQQINYARVNRGLSYEGEGQNRNIPSNLNTVAARDFFFDPTGATTPYTNATSSLKGSTPNILAGDGDHAATDGPTGYQKGYIFNAVLNAGGTVRNYGWMANTPGSIGTIANPISDPFAAGVIQTTTANQLLYENGTYPFQVGQVDFKQFESSAIDCGVFSHLTGSSFGLVQIPRCAYNLSTVFGRMTAPCRCRFRLKHPLQGSVCPSDSPRTIYRLWPKFLRMKWPKYVRPSLPPWTDTFDVTVHGSCNALPVQRDCVRAMFEIVFRIQISNEPGLNRSPSQPLLRQRAGSRSVHTKEQSDPAKMIGCFLASLADDRYVQVPADDLGDLSSRYALVGNAVIPRSGGAFLEHEPVEMSSIVPMHRGPAVEPVAYIRGNALVSRDADQAWHKAMVIAAVDRRGKPQHRCADSKCAQSKRCLLRLAREARIGGILFGCEFSCERALALQEQGPGSDNQRAIRARKHAA
jgi:hypothetical protein